MFYVGAYVHFEGSEKAKDAKIKVLEKLGHSRGRGERFIDEHKPREIDGLRYRAIVLVMPDRFRLTNDVIRQCIQTFKCDWTTAKFHCYRIGSVQAIGKQDVWDDMLTAAKKAEEQKQSTATEPEPIHVGNMPEVPEVDEVKL